MLRRRSSKEISKLLRGFAPLLPVLALIAVCTLGLYTLVAQSGAGQTAHIAPSKNGGAGPAQSLGAAPATESIGTAPTQTIGEAPTSPKTTPTAPKSNTPKPTPKPPTTTPAPSYPLSVSISANGCEVTAKGTPGMQVLIGAHNDRKGGESPFTIPASGTLVQQSGGILGMTSYGKILNASGSVVAAAEAMITVTQCW